MNDAFADWYRICTTGTETNLTGDLLIKRWAGVEKIAGDCEGEGLELVRIVLQRRSAPTLFLGKFKSAFKDADATFQMTGNDLELCVLAGSVLCQIFTEEASEADKTSLGLLCAVRIAGGPAWIEPFVSCAENYLDQRLRERRKPVAVRPPALSNKTIKPHFDAFVASLKENQPEPTSETAKQMCEALLQVLAATTKATASAIAELDKQSQLRREETDVLCWLTAGVSRDLGVTFKQLKSPSAFVVAGKELADLISPPGALPAKSVLHSVTSPATGRAAGKPVTLHAAINSTNGAWRQTLANSLDIDRVADLCPLLAAVKQSLTTDESDAWKAAYKKAYGIDSSVTLQPLDLSHQMHRECLLARLAAVI